MNRLFNEYEIGDFFDEMFSANGEVRPHYQRLARRFSEMEDGEFDRRRLLAEKSYLNQGITFTVYSGEEGTERIFPFDPVPRVIPATTGSTSNGLVQRLTALNLFLRRLSRAKDHQGRSSRESCAARAFPPGVHGFNVPKNIYIHSAART
jgi:uncharacterized circularly permuted ATP-grasp superfamily protein